MEWVATMSHELDSQDLAAGADLGRANMKGGILFLPRPGNGSRSCRAVPR
jgi:hypothetical protein